MWSFLEIIGDLISLVVNIWEADSDIRRKSPLTYGSEFDKQSRRFVASLCGGIILVLVIAGLVLWWFTRSK
jgi:hypothetical protein